MYLLEIEMQGALKIKEKFPEVSLIFITPPSVEELKKRFDQPRNRNNGSD